MLPSMEDRSQTDRVSEGQNRTSGVTNGGGKLGQLLPGEADEEAQSSLAKYNDSGGSVLTHQSCRLTAKNRDQLRNPTLGSRVWAAFTFTLNYHKSEYDRVC